MSLPLTTLNPLSNSPQLLTPLALSSLHESISAENISSFDLSEIQKVFAKHHYTFDEKTKIGIIEIRSTMTYRPSLINMFLGLYNYQQLEEDISELIAKGAKKISLILDSNGGEWYGNLETAAALRKKADKAGVKLFAYIDGVCNAGAYAIATACHQVIANPESSLGSIGISVLLRNTNQAEKMAGVKTTFVFAGNSKIPYDENGDWRKDFISSIQDKVDSAYDSLCEFVAHNRKQSIKSIKDTRAKTFNANDALSHKLIDSIMTRQQFLTYLNSGVSPAPKKTTSIVKPKPTKATVTPPKAVTKSNTRKSTPSDGVRRYLERTYRNNG